MDNLVLNLRAELFNANNVIEKLEIEKEKLTMNFIELEKVKDDLLDENNDKVKIKYL